MYVRRPWHITLINNGLWFLTGCSQGSIDMQEVTGSIPVSPTIEHLGSQGVFLCGRKETALSYAVRRAPRSCGRGMPVPGAAWTR